MRKKLLAAAMAGFMAVSAVCMANVSNMVTYAENETGVFEIKDGVLISYRGTDVGATVVIPDNVTCIGNKAFYRSFGLQGVIIPDSVTIIADEAFGDCSDLKNITIHKI